MSLLASRLLGQLRTQHLEADATLHTLLRTDVTREDYVAFLHRAYGFEAVLDYFARRRDLADRTFRMHPGDVLVGQDDHVAVMTDGTATIDGVERRWSTVGLYRLRGERICACWLLPLDAAAFDAIWAA